MSGISVLIAVAPLSLWPSIGVACIACSCIAAVSSSVSPMACQCHPHQPQPLCTCPPPSRPPPRGAHKPLPAPIVRPVVCVQATMSVIGPTLVTDTSRKMPRILEESVEWYLRSASPCPSPTLASNGTPLLLSGSLCLLGLLLHLVFDLGRADLSP